MPDLPSHSDSTGFDANDEPVAPASRWKTYSIVGVLALAIVVFIGLHLSGVVGPSASH